MNYLILGCGYTGRRVARSLLAQGETVTATTRDPSQLKQLRDAGAKLLRVDVLKPETLENAARHFSPGSIVLLSIPSLKGPEGLFDPTPRIVEALANRPARVVYLSTTGVYGKAVAVDETTPAAPVTERQRLRVTAEQAVAAGPWASLVLRPAAIYGPGRGVHRAMREGRFQLMGDGANYVSRIHVDDLAAIALAALRSDATGAYAVADDQPCTSREIAEFCADLLGVPVPRSAPREKLSETRRSNRKVNGHAIRRLLGVELKYPSYRAGIPAALAEELRTGENAPYDRRF